MSPSPEAARLIARDVLRRNRPGERQNAAFYPFPDVTAAR